MKNSKEKEKEKKKDKTRNKGPLREYAKYSSLAFQMMAILLIAVFGGLKLDEVVKSIEFPLFTFVLTIVGVVLSVYYAIKDFIKFK